MSTPLPKDGDAFPTELGRKIERPSPSPTRGYEPTGTPGVYKAPDGKLVTAIPENEQARWAPSRAALEVDYSVVEQAIKRFCRGEYDVKSVVWHCGYLLSESALKVNLPARAFAAPGEYDVEAP